MAQGKREYNNNRCAGIIGAFACLYIAFARRNERLADISSYIPDGFDTFLRVKNKEKTQIK
jgi:hypothetical protein